MKTFHAIPHSLGLEISKEDVSVQKNPTEAIKQLVKKGYSLPSVEDICNLRKSRFRNKEISFDQEYVTRTAAIYLPVEHGVQVGFDHHIKSLILEHLDDICSAHSKKKEFILPLSHPHLSAALQRTTCRNYNSTLETVRIDEHLPLMNAVFLPAAQLQNIPQDHALIRPCIFGKDDMLNPTLLNTTKFITQKASVLPVRSKVNSPLRYFTSTSHVELNLHEALEFAQQQSSTLQSMVDAAAFRAITKSTDGSNDKQMTRTSAIYFTNGGKTYVGFDHDKDSFLLADARSRSQKKGDHIISKQGNSETMKRLLYQRHIHELPRQLELTLDQFALHPIVRSLLGDSTDLYVDFLRKYKIDTETLLLHHPSYIEQHVKPDELLVSACTLHRPGYAHIDATQQASKTGRARGIYSIEKVTVQDITPPIKFIETQLIEQYDTHYAGLNRKQLREKDGELYEQLKDTGILNKLLPMRMTKF